MVVVIGAGIVGAATAYYLSTTGSGNFPIIVLDSLGPAAGSSGRAGAFLTNRPPTFRRGTGGNGAINDKRRALFGASFELHQQLAKDLDLQSFCRVSDYQTVETEDTSSNDDINSSTSDSLPNDTQQSVLKKLTENGRGVPMPGDAALVDPAELVSSMMDKVLSQRECSFRKASVSGLGVNPSGSCVTGIYLESDARETIPIDEDEPVVIALGPWSCRIEDWLGIPMPIEGVLSTSLIYEDEILDLDVGTAFFFDDDSNGCHLEVFGRKDNSLYVSGCGESQAIGTRHLRSKGRPSPKVPCDPDLARAAAARESLRKVGYHRPRAVTEDPDVIQACIRPMAPDGVPVVGKLLDNVYVATGGGPWGITWGPLMGKSLASLINEESDTPVRLGPFSPQRFDTLVYKTLLKSRSET